MCRFVAYLGFALPINEILSNPKDSLIKQSADALESEVTVNADGFGIGWYTDFKTSPARFLSVQPAWSDINLKSISHHIQSGCFLGHVRAATSTATTLYNCHPFRFNDYLFMHNGEVGGFTQIKRALVSSLGDAPFSNILGNSDSEVLFGLLMTNLGDRPFTQASIVQAWQDTLTQVEFVQRKHDIEAPNYLNVVLTNGKCLSVLHYSTDVDYISSLHYACGDNYQYVNGCYHITPTVNRNKLVIIASEKLTANNQDWHDIPRQQLLFVDENLTIHCTSL